MTKGKSKARKGAREIEVKVDAAMKRRYDALAAVITRTTRSESSAFDERYEAIGEILDSDPPLWVAGGFSTIPDFIAAVVREPGRTVRRMVRVARFASPAEEARYGVAKLDAALSYIEAKTGDSVKSRLPIDWRALRIPIRRGGRERRVPFADVTVDELHAAARALRRPQQHPKDALQKSIEAALRTARVEGVRVHTVHGRVNVTGIAPADVAKVGRALATVRSGEGRGSGD